MCSKRFKILASSSLLMGYVLSVMYVDGVKMSDTQMTVNGFIVAGFHMALSHSKPLTKLSAQRPPAALFQASVVVSILTHFCIHFAVLLYVIDAARPYQPAEKVDPDADFKANVLESAVFLW